MERALRQLGLIFAVCGATVFLSLALFVSRPDFANCYTTGYCCPCGWYDSYGAYHPGEISCYLIELDPYYAACAPCEDDSTSEKDSGTVVSQDVVRATSKEVGRLLSSRIAAIVSSRPVMQRQPAGSPGNQGMLSKTSLFGPSLDSRALTIDEGRVEVHFTDALSRLSSQSFSLDDIQVRSEFFDLPIPAIMSGLSSGDEPAEQAPSTGFWVSGSWSDLENTLSSTEYDGDLYLLMGGMDHMLLDNLLVGTAVGYERTELDTPFNQGELTGNGYSIAPYTSVILTDSLTLDFIGSYTMIDYDTARDRGDVTGSYDADRFMVSGSVNYYYVIKNWNLSARLAYLYSSENSEGFRESNGNDVGYRDTDLGELRVGGRAGYVFGNWEPYLSLYYLYDATMEDVQVGPDQEQPSNDADEVEATLGVNYQALESMIFSLDLTHALFREDTRSTSLSLNWRFDF